MAYHEGKLGRTLGREPGVSAGLSIGAPSLGAPQRINPLKTSLARGGPVARDLCDSRAVVVHYWRSHQRSQAHAWEDRV